MSSSPEVSVVMSVHNGAATLRATAQSVLSQADVDFELIVVDDGSTDETPGILRDLAQSDRRVNAVTQENAGITMGLIRGCALARGKYVARQDAGDYSSEGRLRSQKSALDADESLAFLSCWTAVYGPGREFLSCSTGSGRAASPTHIISEHEKHAVIDGPSHHGSVMFRRDQYLKVGGYRRQFYFGQDWDLWYRLAAVGKFQMIARVLYEAVVTPNSLSGRYRNAQSALAKLSHQMLLRRLRGQPEDDLLQLARHIRPAAIAGMSRLSIAKGHYFIGEQLRRNGDERAGRYLWQAISAAPAYMPAWLRLAQLSASRVLAGKVLTTRKP